MCSVVRLGMISLHVMVATTFLAQSPEETVHGIVTDIKGAAVTTASLQFTQAGFGGGRVLAADAYGRYYITNIGPGDYGITVSAPGFSTVVKRLTLRVGDHL